MAELNGHTLAELTAHHNKTYGCNTCVANTNIDLFNAKLPTGIFALDLALNGGLPLNRLSCFKGLESGGKSSAAMNVAAIGSLICWRCFEFECTCSLPHLDLKTFWCDVEGTFDHSWAEAIGMEHGNYVVAYGDDGEQCADMVESAIRATDCGLVVVDSLAAMTPSKIIEGSSYNQYVGVDPRFITPFIKRIRSRLVREAKLGHPVVCIIINQARFKIGEMFGCFHGETRVTLSSGEVMPIKKIVKNKLPVEVLAFNEATGQIEPRKVVDWHINGKVSTDEDFINFRVDGIDGGTNKGFCCTRTHPILTTNGWKNAETINIGDNLISPVKRMFDEKARQVIYASRIGDGIFTSAHKNKAQLLLQERTQDAYLHWKMDKIPLNFKKYTLKNNVIRYASDSCYELALIRDLKDGLDVIKKLDDFGLAVWFLDDGHLDTKPFKNFKYNKFYPRTPRASISIRRFPIEAGNKIALYLNNKFNFECKYSVATGGLTFNTTNTKKLFKIIGKYIPNCMSYKKPAYSEELYEEKVYSIIEPEYIFAPVEVTHKRKASKKQMRYRTKYDITVEGGHTYLVGGKVSGVIVHNSPVTMSGGQALKHETSLWVNFAKKAQTEAEKKLADDTRHITRAQRHSFTIEKHKQAILFGYGEYVRCKEDIYSGTEVEYKKGDVLDHKSTMKYGKDYNVVKQDNNKWSYGNISGSQKTIIEEWKKNEILYLKAQRDVINAARQIITPIENV